MLPRCDVVVLCAPLTAETRRLVDAAAIARDEADRLLRQRGPGRRPSTRPRSPRRSQTRRLAGAAIDVFAEEPPPAGHPFYDLDNVILSPHVSGFMPSYDDRCAELFAENLRRYLAGAPLLNLVDRVRGY